MPRPPSEPNLIRLPPRSLRLLPPWSGPSAHLGVWIVHLVEQLVVGIHAFTLAARIHRLRSRGKAGVVHRKLCCCAARNPAHQRRTARGRRLRRCDTTRARPNALFAPIAAAADIGAVLVHWSESPSTRRCPLSCSSREEPPGKSRLTASPSSSSAIALRSRTISRRCWRRC
jgi:hypothetical protein